jgi:glycosyltransferase involved in cell wall biosynthesis
MPSIFYLTRNSLLEPLGQSQVMGYLRGLSQDHQITLITFEKPEDLADTQAMAKAEADCEAHGIDWRPKRFRRSPKLFAPAWSMFEMFWSALQAARRGDVQLIHARSYLPAAAAWAVFRLTGTPFIFDMRALWPEELITAGRLQRGSIVHKALTRLEKVCLRDAAAVVSLTDAAVGYLQDQYPTELQEQHIAVIPTCADLQRFKRSNKPPSERVYGCVGTVLSGWFLMDWLAALFNTVAQKDPEARFEVITRDDTETVRAALDIDGKLGDRLSIFPSASESVHEALQKQSTSVMFFTAGTSKLGSAPTRLGEALGCGIPVIANEGVGDVADIIRRYNVGVIVKDASETAMNAALGELEPLRSDPDLPPRCRRAAEEVFSLEAGTEAYRKLYADILGRPDGPAAPNAANDR